MSMKKGTQFPVLIDFLSVRISKLRECDQRGERYLAFSLSPEHFEEHLPELLRLFDPLGKQLNLPQLATLRGLRLILEAPREGRNLLQLRSRAFAPP